jgi:hypothetical protein
MTAETICRALHNSHYNYQNEKDLQHGVSLVLTKLGTPFEPEYIITPKDRIDFLVGDIGIECKVDGTLNQLIRQLGRYAATGQVKELIVLSTRSMHRKVPNEIHGVPIFIVVTSPF